MRLKASRADGRSAEFSIPGQTSPTTVNWYFEAKWSDAPLDKSSCQRLAIMAQDGLAQAIRPAHTPFDGDTVLALSTGTGPVVAPDQLTRLGSAAASCLARAIMRALTAAEPLGGFASWRQRWGSSGLS